MQIMDNKKRNEQILKYAPLVKNVVERVLAKLPPHVSLKEDMMNVGIIGLISAIEKFDPSRNVKFETYARFRIKGAVLDELRAMDWMPRSVRDKCSKLEDAFRTLEKVLERPPNDDEVSQYIGIPLDEYYKMLDEAKGITLLSREDISADNEDLHNKQKFLEGVDQNDPFSFLAAQQLQSVLKGAIDSLPEKERIIISLYYYEEMTMKEIGVIVNLTESRVCQLHTKAMLRLRGRLKELRKAGE